MQASTGIRGRDAGGLRVGRLSCTRDNVNPGCQNPFRGFGTTVDPITWLKLRDVDRLIGFNVLALVDGLQTAASTAAPRWTTHPRKIVRPTS